MISTKELEAWKAQWMPFKQKHPMLRDIHVNACINPWTGLVKQEVGMAHFDACPYADGQHFFIGNTGNIIACCMDLEEEIQFGNVMIDSYKAVTTKRNAFYERQIKGEIQYDVCHRCLER
jgi:radical SAM protein with 4Fe4S-binding SPASM domain